MTRPHLTSMAPSYTPCTCGCRGLAARLIRCRRCGVVLARCGGLDMERLRDQHEAVCR